jgi:hypothetical protein
MCRCRSMASGGTEPESGAAAWGARGRPAAQVDVRRAGGESTSYRDHGKAGMSPREGRALQVANLETSARAVPAYAIANSARYSVRPACGDLRVYEGACFGDQAQVGDQAVLAAGRMASKRAEV